MGFQAVLRVAVVDNTQGEDRFLYGVAIQIMDIYQPVVEVQLRLTEKWLLYSNFSLPFLP